MRTVMSQQQINLADTLWALFLAQTKSVRKELTRRIMALEKEESRTRNVNSKASLELSQRLESIRQEMREGQCVVCNTQEELDSFFASL